MPASTTRPVAGVVPEDAGDAAAPGLVERRADGPHPGGVAEQVGEVVAGLVAERPTTETPTVPKKTTAENTAAPHRRAPTKYSPRHRGRQLDPGREPDQ